MRWAVIFFVVAIIAALFGFTGIDAAATDIERKDWRSCPIS